MRTKQRDTTNQCQKIKGIWPHCSARLRRAPGLLLAGQRDGFRNSGTTARVVETIRQGEGGWKMSEHIGAIGFSQLLSGTEGVRPLKTGGRRTANSVRRSSQGCPMGRWPKAAINHLPRKQGIRKLTPSFKVQNAFCSSTSGSEPQRKQ